MTVLAYQAVRDDAPSAVFLMCSEQKPAGGVALGCVSWCRGTRPKKEIQPPNVLSQAFPISRQVLPWIQQERKSLGLKEARPALMPPGTWTDIRKGFLFTLQPLRCRRSFRLALRAIRRVHNGVITHCASAQDDGPMLNGSSQGRRDKRTPPPEHRSVISRRRAS